MEAIIFFSRIVLTKIIEKFSVVIFNKCQPIYYEAIVLFISHSYGYCVLFRNYILPKICEAQILENQPSEIWIKPSLPLKDMVLTSSPTIGNYFTIDLSQDSTTRKLDELASKQTGSLFIVLRQSLGLDNEPLLSFGPVKLYKDSAIVGSETFPIQKAGYGSNVEVYLSGQIQKRCVLRSFQHR